MTERILLVDDEPRILDGLRRTLHGLYTTDTAPSGAEGLKLIANAVSPYAVVVSDMMMPGMNGAEFLSQAHGASPDTVQMILSGQAELSSTIAAVNDGNLFRFLTKPCESSALSRALDAALDQYRLIISERELLDHTLNGAVEMLTEVMSATNPTAFIRTERVKGLVNAVLDDIVITDAWELRAAVMLGQVGLMAVPLEVITQVRAGGQIEAEAKAVYHTHPALASELIVRIPRMQNVAAWVAAQPVTMADALGPAPEMPAAVVAAAVAAAGDGAAAVTGHDVYAAVMAFATGTDLGLSGSQVVSDLAKSGRYRRTLLDTILLADARTVMRRARRVKGAQLTIGMLVQQDVVTLAGLTLLRAGETLTESMAVRLRHFADGVGLVEPIDVLA